MRNRESFLKYQREYYQRNRSKKLAYSRQRDKATDRSKKRAARGEYKQYYASNKEKKLAYHRKWKYGLEPAQQLELLKRPCAICGGKAMVIDHNHVTNKVRAALCQNCNKGLGNFKDNPGLMRIAANYLDEHA